jgi:hypothetical protein
VNVGGARGETYRQLDSTHQRRSAAARAMTFDAAVYERALRKPPDSMQTRRYSHRRLSIKKSMGNRKERTCRKADHARVPADRAASCVSSKKENVASSRISAHAFVPL